MNSLRFRIPIAMFIATTAIGCASDPYRLDAPRSVEGFLLAPFAIQEECVALQPRDRIDYRFKSTVPVAFNIHYHDGNAVLMPLSRDAVLEDAGDFTASVAQIYCLMWEAGAQGGVLDYQLRPLPRR
jgi:hypothetical protein